MAQIYNKFNSIETFNNLFIILNISKQFSFKVQPGNKWTSNFEDARIFLIKVQWHQISSHYIVQRHYAILKLNFMPTKDSFLSSFNINHRQFSCEASNQRNTLEISDSKISQSRIKSMKCVIWFKMRTNFLSSSGFFK